MCKDLRQSETFLYATTCVVSTFGIVSGFVLFVYKYSVFVCKYTFGLYVSVFTSMSLSRHAYLKNPTFTLGLGLYTDVQTR